MNPNFFIVGAQRSGTTLLRLILNSHTKIIIPEESGFLMPLLNSKNSLKVLRQKEILRIINYLESNEQLKLWKFDFKIFKNKILKYERLTLIQLLDVLFESYKNTWNKEIIGDKTPSFFRKIKILKQINKNIKFIHIIRDGRDVFNSMRNFDKSKNNPSVMALDWNYKNHMISKSLESLDSSCKIKIRYEDILDRPVDTINTICTFLDIDFEEEMLSFYKESKFHIGKHHSKLIFSPINNKNKEKWKTELSSFEQKTFNSLSKKILLENSYELLESKINFTDYLKIYKNIFTGIPLRLFEVFRIKILHNYALRTGRPVSGLKVGKPAISKKGK